MNGGKARSMGYIPTECPECGKYTGHESKPCPVAVANQSATKRTRRA